MADHRTGRNSTSGTLLLALLVALPAFSYPLSWFPKSWTDFRYDCTLRLPEMILAAGLLISVVWLLCGRERDDTGEGNAVNLLPRNIILPVLAVVLSAVASTRFSEYPQYGLALLSRLAGNLAIFLLAAHAPKDRLGQLGNWWMLAAVVVAVNGLLRLGSELEFISTFGNWDFLGTYLAASLVIMVSRGDRWSVLGSLILIVAMVFCRSRGAWLALGAVSLLGFVGFGNQFLQRRTTRVVITAAILAGSVLLARPYVVRQWQMEVRPMIWKATVKMVAARPLLGHGLGTYVVVYPRYRLPEYFLRLKATNVTDHAHNELLEVAAEQGVIGLAATLWLWGMAVWYGFRACRKSNTSDRRFWWGTFAAMLVFMLHSFLDVDLRYLPNQSFLWMLMGLVVGADTVSSRWQRITIHPGPVRWCLAGVCLVLGLWIMVSSVFRPLSADLQDRQARIAEEREDLVAATHYAQNALSFDAFRLNTRYLLAGVLSRQMEPQAHELAIEQCQRIEELAPDYADVTYNLGQLLLSDGRATEAVPYLRRAVEINPYDAERRVILASVLRDVGENDEAQQHLDRALRLQPQNAAAQDLQRKMQSDSRR